MVNQIKTNKSFYVRTHFLEQKLSYAHKTYDCTYNCLLNCENYLFDHALIENKYILAQNTVQLLPSFSFTKIGLFLTYSVKRKNFIFLF